MMEQSKTTPCEYLSPSLEVMLIEPEKGFAQSGTEDFLLGGEWGDSFAN